MAEPITLTTQIKNLANLPVDVSNRLLSSFEGNEKIVLFVIAVVIAFFMKKRYNENNLMWIIFTILVFGFLRWIGIGG